MPLEQAPVLALLVQGLVQGLVPAQGPLVRPGLRVFRRVAVVLAFLFTLLFFHMTLVIVPSPIDGSFGATLEAPRGNMFCFRCMRVQQDVGFQSSFGLHLAFLAPSHLALNHRKF